MHVFRLVFLNKMPIYCLLEVILCKILHSLCHVCFTFRIKFFTLQPKQKTNKVITSKLKKDMKKNYFFAPIYKKIGWALFVPSAILVALHMYDSGIADCDFGACYTFSVIPTGIDDALANKDHTIGDLSFWF